MHFTPTCLLIALVLTIGGWGCTQTQKEASVPVMQPPVQAQTIEKGPVEYVSKDQLNYYTLYDGTSCVGPYFLAGQPLAIPLKGQDMTDSLRVRFKNGQREYVVTPRYFVRETGDVVVTVDSVMRAGNYTVSLVRAGKPVSDCYAISVLAYSGQPYFNMLNCFSAKCQPNDEYVLQKGELYTLGVPYTVSGNGQAGYLAPYAGAEQAEVLCISTADSADVYRIRVTLPKSVESVPRFTLPDDLKPGSYWLKLAVGYADGKNRQSELFQYRVVVR
ncbi:hypothetical protein F5984_01915 [Rudanella paleaurantiibacter]|uniref:Uncharacterized protein n=1 Tax=Rudanella paleaurantiibacter TaxID=2614655 RepID=A0A7J5U6F1_9BACT|nr:hypothetical protein [Rudanella paleaurantiibacter]KAB7732730.1 hypothetical protein F5984_01915 [Rudanella paleaurantiibacter]